LVSPLATRRSRRARAKTFADVGILGSERRDTIEIIPMRSCWEGSIGVRGLLLFR
jgi:hypothetical protein